VATPKPALPTVWNGITLNLPATVKAGQDFVADATLLASGVPVVGVGVHFLVDGSQNHMAPTDNSGVAHFKQRGTIPAGIHRIDASYGSAAASGTIEVVPMTLTIQVVPATAGVTVTLDDKSRAVSDAKGSLALSVGTPGMHALKTGLPADGEKVRYRFARWSDEATDPNRQVRVELDMTLALGVRISYLTSIQFADLDGRPLDPALVSGVTLSGPNAEVMKLDYPYPPAWLQTAMPAKYTSENGLHLTPAPYSVGTAYYDSNNVASRGKERYLPDTRGEWTVKLLLFRLRLHAQDAIFGSSLSKPVTLTHPSGRKQTLGLNRDGETTLVLGRGNYVAFVQSPGVSPPAPIALSKSQTAVIPVITPIDLVIIVLTASLVLAAVFALGRGEPVVLLFLQRVRRGMARRHSWITKDTQEPVSGREPSAQPNGRLREHI
jgi:hypothetical protein